MKSAKQVLIEYMQEVSLEEGNAMSVEEIDDLLSEGDGIGVDFTVPMERFANQFRQSSPC